MIALAAALILDAPRSLRGRLGPALIAYTGVAQILDGFPFPADCRRTIDAGCHARELAGELSWQHYAHGWAYFFGGAALLLSVFAMAWRFREDPRWGRADALAFGAGIVAIAIFSGLFFFTGKGLGGTSETPAHAWRRRTLRGAASSVGQIALLFGLPASLPRLVRRAPVAHASFASPS